jgi:ATP-dependent Clp protease protease subunit
MYKKIFLAYFLSFGIISFAESAPPENPVEADPNKTASEKTDSPGKLLSSKQNTTTPETAKEATALDTESKSKPKLDVRTGHDESENASASGDDTGALTEQLSRQAKDKVLTETTSNEANAKAQATVAAKPRKVVDPVLERLNKEQKLLMMENIVREERLKKQNTELRTKLQQLRWEKDVLNAQLDVDALRDEVKNKQETKQHQDKIITLTREVELSEEHTRKLNSDLEAQRLQGEFETAKLEAEIASFHITKERNKYTSNKAIALDNPVIDGDTLVISDRRIEMNGLIASETADYVSTRINFYNNKDKSKPIFLVIDSSPGGSAMAGYRIIKAMESSKAPIYVVVKSLAASMAAIITTVAEHSFAYPNSIIVHHQLSITLFLARLNVTQQKEMYEDTQKWWDRMMGPVSKKMGISNDEFIKQMYAKASSGDWSEFGTEAKELKWVNKIVQRIEETSIVKDPDAEQEESSEMMQEELSAKGHSVVYLPHLAAKDVYFVYNPDQYYQLR